MGDSDFVFHPQVLAFAKAMVAAASRVLTPLGEPVQMRVGG
jgi:hypothetical protein